MSLTASCEWVIELPTRLRPTLSFSVMDLRQNNTACPTSYVEVRNGGTSTSPLMGRFCNVSNQLTNKSAPGKLMCKKPTLGVVPNIISTWRQPQF